MSVHIHTNACNHCLVCESNVCDYISFYLLPINIFTYTHDLYYFLLGSHKVQSLVLEAKSAHTHTHLLFILLLSRCGCPPGYVSAARFIKEYSQHLGKSANIRTIQERTSVPSYCSSTNLISCVFEWYLCHSYTNIYYSSEQFVKGSSTIDAGFLLASTIMSERK